jgi:hypothetical protein
MTYHISKIFNKSSKSVAITNPATESDSRLIPATTLYTPKVFIAVNSITPKTGTVPYQDAAGTALNIYTASDNFCFWDNGNNALNGVGESNTSDNNIDYYNGPAGNLILTVNDNNSISFALAES